MVRPLLLAEPGPGDASCTIWTLSVYFHPLYSQAGRPSSKFAVRSSPVFRPLPSASNLSIFLVCFQSRDLLHLLPICRSSPFVSNQSIFFVSFRFRNLPHQLPICRSSPSASSPKAFSVRFQPYGLLRSSRDTSLAVGGFLCNGGSKLLP